MMVPMRISLFESLEPRTLLAGVHVITHGYQSSNNAPAWLSTMKDAIVARTGADTAVYNLRIVLSGGNPVVQSFTLASGISPFSTSSNNAEAVVVVDWAAASGVIFSGTNTDNVAQVISTQLLGTFPSIGLTQPLAQLPIYLGGHSRGSSVMSELARFLAEKGVWVDQLNTWDPHPVQQSFPITLNDPNVTVRDNVVFADNYYETSDIVAGVSVPGAYNVNLTGQPGMNHSATHTYYHGTIDRDATTDGDGGTVNNTWYGGNRASTAYDWSRQGQGTRPAAGLSSLGGGSATRVHVNLVGSSNWSNVGSVGATDGNDNVFQFGEPVTLSTRFQDVDGGATVSVWLDIDRTPFNSNATQLGASVVVSSTGATPGSAVQQFMTNWPALTDGVYRVFARIVNTDGFTRYAYSNNPIVAASAGALTVNKTWTGDIAGDSNWTTAGNWTPGGAPGVTDRAMVGGATVNVSSSLTLFSLGVLAGATVGVGPHGSRVLRLTGSFAALGNGRVDLADNAMIVDDAQSLNLPAVQSALVAGYASGSWNGPGITSSAAAGASGGSTRTAIGLALASDLFSTFPATFAGQSVDSTSVLMRYTLAGDANLDRTVNGADFNILAGSFGSAGQRWSGADFTFDSLTNGSDFNVLAANFGKSLPGDATGSRSSSHGTGTLMGGSNSAPASLFASRKIDDEQGSSVDWAAS